MITSNHQYPDQSHHDHDHHHHNHHDRHHDHHHQQSPPARDLVPGGEKLCHGERERRRWSERRRQKKPWDHISNDSQAKETLRLLMLLMSILYQNVDLHQWHAQVGQACKNSRKHQSKKGCPAKYCILILYFYSKVNCRVWKSQLCFAFSSPKL